jgi:hypothetical protein
MVELRPDSAAVQASFFLASIDGRSYFTSPPGVGSVIRFSKKIVLQP